MTHGVPAAGVLGRATARVPGTCGELVQGLIDGRHFHVTCPIDLYGEAAVELVPGGRVLGPEDSPKAAQAVRLALARMGGGLGAVVRLNNPLPRGKGFASSTVDVAGAIAAAFAAAGRPFRPEDIASLAVEVEPTDGVMFPGIALFDHREGGWLELLGDPPPLWVLVLDFGGAVDTVAFNAQDRMAALAGLEPQWREALGLVREGIARGDASLVGRGATLSALAHSQVAPAPHLPGALELARRGGALGVNVAHSGTAVGLLFGDRERADAMVQAALGQLPLVQSARVHRVVGGGMVIAAQPSRIDSIGAFLDNAAH